MTVPYTHLRVGNIVYNGKAVSRVNISDLTAAHVIKAFDGRDVFTGVQITGSVLEKLGFNEFSIREGDITEWRIKLQLLIPINNLIVVQDVNWFFYMDDMLIRQFEYVHQLQNLVHSIFDIEL